MNLSMLFSSLLPSHPDLLPILQNIRKKYGIPEINPDDIGMKEILLSDNDIDWLSVRQEIEAQVRNKPELLPPSIKPLLKLNHPENQPLLFIGLEEVPEELRNQINAFTNVLISQIIDPVLKNVNEYYRVVTDSLFEFLLTGTPREVPTGWFGVVTTTSMFGEPMVIALAAQASDPKAISDQFRQEFTKTFGKDRPKLSEGNLKTGEYLRMKLAGMPIKDIVDVYIQRHRSEFPNDEFSKEYRATKRKHEEMMKKRIQRLQNTINEILGDNK
jgi:hypothetical protein